MSLDEIKELNRHILTIDELENLEAEENVLRIEHLGFSGSNISLLWYDVALTDSTNIDIYIKVQESWIYVIIVIK